MHPLIVSRMSVRSHFLLLVCFSFLISGRRKSIQTALFRASQKSRMDLCVHAVFVRSCVFTEVGASVVFSPQIAITFSPDKVRVLVIPAIGVGIRNRILHFFRPFMSYRFLLKNCIPKQLRLLYHFHRLLSRVFRHFSQSVLSRCDSIYPKQ